MPASSFFSSRVVSCIVLVFVLYVIRSKSIQLPGQSVSYFTERGIRSRPALTPPPSLRPAPPLLDLVKHKYRVLAPGTLPGASGLLNYRK